jgi:hypothetical protein
VSRKWTNEVESQDKNWNSTKSEDLRKNKRKQKRVDDNIDIQSRHSSDRSLDSNNQIYMTFRDIRARYLSLDAVSHSGGPHSVSLPFSFTCFQVCYQ